jgi:hypothetical protein
MIYFSLTSPLMNPKYLLLSFSVLGNVSLLAEYLTGTFDSGLQSLYNPSYFDVSVTHCPVSIDETRPDSFFLVAEQRISTSTIPYRTRLLELRQEGNKTLSIVHRPLNNNYLVNLCSRDKDQQKVTMASFSKDDVCIVELVLDGTVFTGSTSRDGTVLGCKPSSGEGFVSSTITLTNNLMKSWDKGLDVNGQQTWGPREGPYLFNKVTNMYGNQAKQYQKPAWGVQLASYWMGTWKSEKVNAAGILF